MPYVPGRDDDLDLADLLISGVEANGAPLPETIYRLKEGAERFLITDINNPAASANAQSEIPIMWDTWGDTRNNFGALPGDPAAGIVIFNHVPGGSNVLFLDGHVEFLKYKSEYPVKDDPAGSYGVDFSGFLAIAAGFG